MLLKNKIGILTTARSDFGLLKGVISESNVKFKQIFILVSGSHFLSNTTETLDEIDLFISKYKNVKKINLKIKIDKNKRLNQVEVISKTQKKALHKLKKINLDILIFLGDRWDLWGVTVPAFLEKIPLVHISGGEVTEGVIDDSIRHAHTKLASLHFVANEIFARNISLMGEEDWRISISGECGLDEIYNFRPEGFDEIYKKYGVNLWLSSLLITLHPETLSIKISVLEQINSLLSVLTNFKNYQIIFTSPGYERGADVILKKILIFIKENKNAKFVNHFGRKNYLTVMMNSLVVVGNSSSGLVEAPSLGIPTVNIGNRQRKRLCGNSIINVPYDSEKINLALNKALSKNFQDLSKESHNPYDPYKDGRGSIKIVNKIAYILNTYSRKKLILKKFNNEINAKEWFIY